MKIKTMKSYALKGDISAKVDRRPIRRLNVPSGMFFFFTRSDTYQIQWNPESERYKECLFGYLRIVHTDICSFTLVFSHGDKSRAGQGAP